MVQANESKNILITGGAGFIGSHLCDYFIQNGYSVICVDNFLTGSKKNIQHLVDNGKFELSDHDITKPLHFRRGIDSVFHFASPASPIDYLKHPIKTLKVGSLGTHNALGIAKEKNAKFVLASTSEVYGDPEIHPQVETYWGHVNPVGPRGVYDEAKRFSEAIALAYQRTHNVKVRIARIFNTYGPRMRAKDGRVIPNFINQALDGEDITVYGDGTQTRSFGYVDDLIRGLIALWKSSEIGPFNLGNPVEYNMLDLAKTVLKLTGSGSKLVFESLPVDDPKRRCPDIEKAKKYLNWQPRVELEDGLKTTIEYFAKGRK
jgi:dTDP-glucose 4,6-dehydratase